jgi:hypothetical protein
VSTNALEALPVKKAHFIVGGSCYCSRDIHQSIADWWSCFDGLSQTVRASACAPWLLLCSCTTPTAKLELLLLLSVHEDILKYKWKSSYCKSKFAALQINYQKTPHLLSSNSEPGTVTHACNPNYLGDWDQEAQSSRPAQAKKFVRLISLEKSQAW